ncbi:DUF2637 domain-containing protein [Streptomyces sp. C11-1]|uniref:DUF2637 domain-containing protein n=1 Tax=Streptomyces durocortorensis TaxID=2811104 RepID=A0ABY9VVU1_9ACTN|nr:DUF2637 domain-containing protein [Streptomyces durocortorensis]WNF27823.1 DUF2637 domain-containing protein [Streptomyces durocortorensis]
MPTTPISPPPPHQPPDDRPGERQPTNARQAAEQYTLLIAGAVIVILTAGAFWLSYAHLAEVAGRHGLGSSPMRRWAWPATLDAFIVAGELLMLRAGLRQVTDWWAIGLTAAGSIGSIVLNAVGVNSTGNASSVPFLDYVVAAVPPTAAMLAFAALMRQVHQLVGRSTDCSEPDSGQALEVLTVASTSPVEPPAVTAAEAQDSEPSAQDSQSKPRGGRPPKATIEGLAEIGRIAAFDHRKLTRELLREAVEDKGLTIGSERLTRVMKLLRPELEAHGITVSASG